MDYVWLGTRSMIFPSITVGEGAIIGVNTTVTKDVDGRTIFAGIPAKKIGERNCELNYTLNYRKKFH